MIHEETIDFLRRTPPFQFLDEAGLKAAARGASLEFFPRDTLIMDLEERGGRPSDWLYVIKKGAVKVFADRAEAVVVDYAGEGDMFGYSSVMSGRPSRNGVRAMEDTLCYLVGRDVLRSMVEVRPELNDYFLRTTDRKFADKALEELRRRSGGSGTQADTGTGWTERLLYARTAGEVVSAEYVQGPASMTVRDAARLMTRGRKSALVVQDEAGRPLGIVTDSDFRAKVAAGAMGSETPVERIMTSPVIGLAATEPCFEALLTMLHHNIHHLLVLEGERVAGILSNHDVMMLQGGSPLALVKKIEDAETVDELRPVSESIDSLIGLLLQEGARAGHITRVASEITERMLRRVLALAEAELGPPPLPYSFIVFGSEGRKEQSYRTDQDNAIVYANPATETEAEAAEQYLEGLAGFVGKALAGLGYPPCPAGYMATNPAWRQPLKAWKRQFTSWIAEPSAEALLRSAIFFDFRHGGGDPGPAAELGEHLYSTVAANRNFLGFLAGATVRNTPPLGFLKSFMVEKSGEHKDSFNIKVKGTAPLVDIVRLFSLEKGVRETSTTARLSALAPVHSIVREHGDEALAAFEFLMLLKMHHQRVQAESGLVPDNYVNPYALSSLEKRTLKQAFGIISRLQDIIIERYRAFIW